MTMRGFTQPQPQSMYVCRRMRLDGARVMSDRCSPSDEELLTFILLLIVLYVWSKTAIDS